ncbi:MAG: protein kinase [Archangium sp.]|nr:protein kinase [Archangium sp.]
MASNIPDLSGRSIGEYEIVARVGVGGMGEVYEGRHPLIGKRVAVKVLLPSLSNEAELVERFLSEARAVNEIRHRGIVDIFSFGQLPEGSRYFVMEFLEGEAFDKIIKKRSPLPMAETLGWADEMLDALEAAHSAGIIHRDIKPSNLFLVNTGRGRPYVKLLDFGIAKLGAIAGEATPQTRASVILGTPDYISPEQARGKAISPQTDLYALGCVLFEMLTGERVFRGENTLQTMWMHVEDKPPVPSSIRPDIPPELDEVILWALEKESVNRPPSAAVMRDQLLAIKNQLAPTGQFTPPPTTSSGGQRPISTTPPPSGRNRVVGSTPAPRSGSLAPVKTPAPRSGGHPSISGRTRSPPAPPAVTAPGTGGASPETRMSPLTAMTGEAPLPSSPSLQLDVAGEEAAPVAPKSKLPLILAGLVGLLALGVAALFAMSNDTQQPEVPPIAPVDVKPVEPPKVEPPRVDPPKDPVANVEPPKVDPPKDPVANVEPPKVVEPPVKVDPPKPKGRVITTEALVARLKKIEALLASKEAETGQKDAVLRQFIEQGRKEIQKATNDSDRKAAWGFLGDIEGQLKR